MDPIHSHRSSKIFHLMEGQDIRPYLLLQCAIWHGRAVLSNECSHVTRGNRRNVNQNCGFLHLDRRISDGRGRRGGRTFMFRGRSIIVYDILRQTGMWRFDRPVPFCSPGGDLRRLSGHSAISFPCFREPYFAFSASFSLSDFILLWGLST